MGAWGHGIFDDDTAYDYVNEIDHADNPKEIFKTAFDNAIESEYLEYDDCHAVTVSASYIDSILNGTRPRIDAEDENYFQFVENNKNLEVADLKSNAVKALQIVISDNSELNELWNENEELYPEWKKNIEDLINRLK